MGLLDSVFKNIPVVGQVINMVDAIKSGDFKALLSSVSSLALTFATGGAGAIWGRSHRWSRTSARRWSGKR